MSPTRTPRSAPHSTGEIQITTNALCKRIKRVAFGMTNFIHWRIRVLLYAGRPDWSRLDTIAPA